MASFVPVKLSYTAFEPVNGTDAKLCPVIFMHGLSGCKEFWQDLPQTIADKTSRKTYAYDARNHGDSEHSDEFSFDLNVDDLFHFMDTMNIPKAVLVGHSMGGLTATNAALRKPERIEMLFSEDMPIKKIPKEMTASITVMLGVFLKAFRSVPKNINNISEATDFAFNIMTSELSQVNTQASTQTFFTPEMREDFEKVKERAFKGDYWYKRTPDGGYDVKYNAKAIFKALENPDTLVSEPEGQYDGTAIFIYGSRSPLGVKNEESHIKKHFPNAELIEFVGAGHSVNLLFPEKYTETIIHYLQKTM